jgi:hypothetical protein
LSPGQFGFSPSRRRSGAPVAHRWGAASGRASPRSRHNRQFARPAWPPYRPHRARFPNCPGDKGWGEGFLRSWSEGFSRDWGEGRAGQGVTTSPAPGSTGRVPTKWVAGWGVRESLGVRAVKPNLNVTNRLCPPPQQCKLFQPFQRFTPVARQQRRWCSARLRRRAPPSPSSPSLPSSPSSPPSLPPGNTDSAPPSRTTSRIHL